MKYTKIVSLSLIAVLVASSFFSSHADVSLPKQNDPDRTIFVESQATAVLTKDYTINIEEAKHKVTNQEVSVTLVKRPVVDNTLRIGISEKMLFSNDDGSEHQIYLLKHNPIHAILDRIFNQRKFKLDKLVGVSYTDTMASPDNGLLGSLSDGLTNDQNGDFDEITLSALSSYEMKNSIAIELQPILTSIFIQSSYSSFVNDVGYVVDLAEQQSTTLLFISAISAFYVIVRSENPIVKTQQTRRFLSFVFIAIILSSAIITPLSISSSYYAHAEMDDSSNMTEPEIPETVSDDTVEVYDIEIPLSIDPGTDIQSLDDDTPQTPETPQAPANSTIPQDPQTPETPSNSAATKSLTEILGMANPAIPSAPETPSNSTATKSLTEILGMAKITSSNKTEYSVVIPNATHSWGSNSTQAGSKLLGQIGINQTGLNLEGGFIKYSDIINQTEITVAAWVKPTYSSGASVLTVISKERSYELTISNIPNKPHIATFSVFDGIKWHDIQTTSEIGDSWSHIAAAFNGTDISIYINGTLSGAGKTKQTIAIDSNGNILDVIPGLSNANTDIVIGATLHSRTVDTAQRAFSGSMDQIEIYSDYLTTEQIFNLYSRTLPMIFTKHIPIPIIEEIIPEPINLLNQTGINGTISTNMTQYVATPTMNKTSQITISVWADPIYDRSSDEFTVVSKDRSFALSLNNVFEPKRTAKFSVFDGIKWTEIQGTHKIESRSHIAAVINGTEITLYVNGTLQERKSLPNSFAVLDGKIVTTSAETANSPSDIVVGAYVSIVRGELHISNKFSGTIDDATIYNRVLTPSEIKQIFSAQIAEVEPSKTFPLFAENVLGFIDIVVLTLIPKSISSPANTQRVEDGLGMSDHIALISGNLSSGVSKTYPSQSLGIADSVKITLSSALFGNYTTNNERLGMTDTINLISVNPKNNTSFGESFGITDRVTVIPLPLPIKDDGIILEERGKDYYKVEYKNGTGQITFGLPDWILDPATNEYVEHIIRETDDEIIYDSMQIPFIFDKNDCSLRIYDKGIIDSDSSLTVGKKYWKLMQAQAGTNQWTESQINNNSCRIESFENSTGFFINAIRENSDGVFTTTYGKKTDQPLESFLYYTNTNEDTQSTKFGFVQELESIESDEADLGNEIITTRQEVAQKLADKGRKAPNRVLDDFTDPEKTAVKQLKQLEQINKRKVDIVSDTVLFATESQDSLVFDFSKATKEFSNLKIENKNGKLNTRFEFLEIAAPLKKDETLFLDPTVTFSSGTFREVRAGGTGATCPLPSSIAQPSAAEASVTRTTSSTGCHRTAREFDISSIDNRAIITNITSSFTTNAFGGTRTCEINPMQFRPTSFSLGGTVASPNPDALQLWNDIGNGTAYATGVVCAAASGGPISLGSSGIANFQAAIDSSQTWFALGYKLQDETRLASGGLIGSRFSGISITVTYSFKQNLSENLGMTDAIAFVKSLTQNPTENLGMTDSILILKNTLKSLTENLGMTGTAATVPVLELTENLGMSDAVTTRKSQIALTENLAMTTAIQLARTSGELKLTENFGLSDAVTAKKLISVSLTENLGFTDAIDKTRSILPSEGLGLVDSVTTQRFPSVEFNTQNDCTVISAGSATATLTAGVDYDEPQGEAFIRIVDTRQQGLGRTSGGGSQNADDVTVYISDADFAGGSITFTRAGITNDDRICWQIVDYQGKSESANAIKVLDVGTVTHTTSGLTVDTSTISGVTNDNDVVVFITGQSNVDTARGDWNTAMNTAEWIGASDIARFTREEAGSDANPLSYAVVEFTGSNWSVQRVEHAYTSTNAETESITDVGSLSRAFFHHQHRAGAGGLDEVGGEVYFSATNQITFDLQDSANLISLAAVVWVVSNSQTGPDAMIVEHKGGTRSGGATEEYYENISINTVRGLSTTSLMGENARSQGTGTVFPVGNIAFNLTSASNVVLITSETSNTQNYRFQVVQWPIKPAKTHEVTLTERLGIEDSVETILTAARAERLGMSDTIAITANTSQPLTENLGMTDNVATTASRTQSLTENLGMTDNVATTATRTQSLTENLGMTDQTATTATRTQSLTENLGMTDAVQTTATRTQSLTENLGMTDNVATTATRTQSLTENLGMTDAVTTTATRTQSLTENLGMTDNVATTASRTQSLTENLGMTDNVQTTATRTQSLTENLGMTDAVATTATRTQSLTENLGMTDNVATTKSATQSLTENLGMTDAIVATTSKTKSLSESLGLFDVPDNEQQMVILIKSLRESLAFSDKILFKGQARIDARDISSTLIGGASYSVYPNPYGGASPLTVVDGGSNDTDSIVGRVTIERVPFGTYNFTMTAVPSGYNVLGNSTSHEVHPTQINGIAVFRVATQDTNLQLMQPTVITTQPSLSNATYTTWTSTYSAIVRNQSSTTTISKVSDLPPVISVGNATSASTVNNAILKQASVQLTTSFASQTNGTHIIKTFGVLNYSLPKSPELTSVIPSFVTQASGNQPQYIATPPLEKIIPGQVMIMPVERDLLPSWGGLSKLEVHPKSTASSTTNDWLVVETSPTIPTQVGSSGLTASNVELFVEVKYRYDEENVGFDWSNSANHQKSPKLTVKVEKSDLVESDSNGCPVITPYMRNDNTGVWEKSGTVLSTTSIDANSCEVVMEQPHFSRFAATSTPKASTPSTPGTSTGSTGGAVGGGGAGGGGAVGGAATGQAGFGGRLVEPVIIYEITYDVCERNMVSVIVGVHGTESPPPFVKIRTPQKEVYSAELAKEQPYEEANKILPTSRYVYEAPLDPNVGFFIVTAEQIEGRTSVSASYLANIYQCRETIIVNPMRDLDRALVFEPTVGEGRPNIFDIKFQVNGNKPIRSTEVNHYVEPKSQVAISAIVDSNSLPQRAELRVIQAGGNYSNYAAVRMNISPLLNITNVYTVSAELPPSFLQAPAIVYWIHVVNSEQKIQASERYYLGVKPSYELDARMELDSPPNRAEGSSYRPTAYVYNQDDRPLFGTVSLLVDGKPVYTSPEQLFNKGQSVVDLEWQVPETQAGSQYVVNARLNLYDKAIDTAATTLKTFPATAQYSISEPIQASSVTENGEIVARVGLLYSSDSNTSLHYRVVAPDGTCVIGSSNSCAVRDSTAGQRGNTVSVEVDGQIYRIRYSGQDNPLERFSITSIDPIVGTWSVSLESDAGIVPEAHAIEDVVVKLKYRSTYTKLITTSSD